MFSSSQSLKQCLFRNINAIRVSNSLRMKCQQKKKGGNKCKKQTSFPCGKPDAQAKKPASINEKKITKPKSIWLNPFCDEDAPYCPFNPRFDDIYYVESDKAKRKYWQTWVSCPPMKMKKKKICCFEKIKAAPLRRRTRKPMTACPQPVDCDVAVELDCPKAKRRCHRAGRIPPDCVKTKRPLFCSKPLTPYPAFSECVRMRPSALPLSECVCWSKPMLCEMWAEWRRRSMLKKKRM